MTTGVLLLGSGRAFAHGGGILQGVALPGWVSVTTALWGVSALLYIASLASLSWAVDFYNWSRRFEPRTEESLRLHFSGLFSLGFLQMFIGELGIFALLLPSAMDLQRMAITHGALWAYSLLMHWLIRHWPPSRWDLIVQTRQRNPGVQGIEPTLEMMERLRMPQAARDWAYRVFALDRALELRNPRLLRMAVAWIAGTRIRFPLWTRGDVTLQALLGPARVAELRDWLQRDGDLGRRIGPRVEAVLTQRIRGDAPVAFARRAGQAAIDRTRAAAVRVRERLPSQPVFDEFQTPHGSVLWRRRQSRAPPTVTLADIRHAQQILARVPGLIVRTPIVPFPQISARTGFQVAAKDEGQHEAGSFKPRLFAKLIEELLDHPQRYHTITSATTGNQGIALAMVIAALRQAFPKESGHLRVVIFVGKDAPAFKIQRMEALDATVVRVEGAYPEATAASQKLAEQAGVRFVAHAGRDAMISYGTLAIELFEDLVAGWKADGRIAASFDVEEFLSLKAYLPERFSRDWWRLQWMQWQIRPMRRVAVIAPSGAAGLYAGVLAGLKLIEPRATVLPAMTRRLSSLHDSMKAGEIVAVEVDDEFYLEDGIKTGAVEQDSLDAALALADGSVLIPHERVAAGIRGHYRETRTVPEPLRVIYAETGGMISEGAAVTPYLALPAVRDLLRRRGVRQVMLISTGRNIDPEEWQRAVHPWRAAWRNAQTVWRDLTSLWQPTLAVAGFVAVGAIAGRVRGPRIPRRFSTDGAASVDGAEGDGHAREPIRRPSQTPARVSARPVNFVGAQFAKGTWWNTALRWVWMATLVTPLHEAGHLLTARLFKQDVSTTRQSFWFSGEVNGIRGAPLLGGALATLLTLPLLMFVLGVPFDLHLTHLTTQPGTVLLSLLTTSHLVGTVLELVAPDGDLARWRREAGAEALTKRWPVDPNDVGTIEAFRAFAAQSPQHLRAAVRVLLWQDHSPYVHQAAATLALLAERPAGAQAILDLQGLPTLVAWGMRDRGRSSARRALDAISSHGRAEAEQVMEALVRHLEHLNEADEKKLIDGERLRWEVKMASLLSALLRPGRSMRHMRAEVVVQAIRECSGDTLRRLAQSLQWIPYNGSAYEALLIQHGVVPALVAGFRDASYQTSEELQHALRMMLSRSEERQRGLQELLSVLVVPHTLKERRGVISLLRDYERKGGARADAVAEAIAEYLCTLPSPVDRQRVLLAIRPRQRWVRSALDAAPLVGAFGGFGSFDMVSATPMTDRVHRALVDRLPLQPLPDERQAVEEALAGLQGVDQAGMGQPNAARHAALERTGSAAPERPIERLESRRAESTETHDRGWIDQGQVTPVRADELLSPRLLERIAQLNAGTAPAIITVEGAWNDAIHQLNVLDWDAHGDRHVILFVHLIDVKSPNRDRSRYVLAIDQASKLREDFRESGVIYTDSVLEPFQHGAYDLLLRFDINNPRDPSGWHGTRGVRLDLLTIGDEWAEVARSDSERLGGLGLDAEIFARFVAALEVRYAGWPIRGIPRTSIIAHCMEQYFDAKPRRGEYRGTIAYPGTVVVPQLPASAEPNAGPGPGIVATIIGGMIALGAWVPAAAQTLAKAVVHEPVRHVAANPSIGGVSFVIGLAAVVLAARMFGDSLQEHETQVDVARAQRGDGAARERVLAGWRHLIDRALGFWAKRLPRPLQHDDREDAITGGLLALHASIDGYKLERGPFETYAWIRVRGGVGDALQGIWKRLNEEPLEARSPEDAEDRRSPADYLEAREDTSQTVVQDASIETRRQTVEDVMHALQRRQRDRDIVHAYMELEPKADIARRFGLSASRVRQIIDEIMPMAAEVISRLHPALAPGFGADTPVRRGPPYREPVDAITELVARRQSGQDNSYTGLIADPEDGGDSLLYSAMLRFEIRPPDARHEMRHWTRSKVWRVLEERRRTDPEGATSKRLRRPKAEGGDPAVEYWARVYGVPMDRAPKVIPPARFETVEDILTELARRAREVELGDRNPNTPTALRQSHEDGGDYNLYESILRLRAELEPIAIDPTHPQSHLLAAFRLFNPARRRAGGASGWLVGAISALAMAAGQGVASAQGLTESAARGMSATGAGWLLVALVVSAWMLRRFAPSVGAWVASGTVRGRRAYAFSVLRRLATSALTSATSCLIWATSIARPLMIGSVKASSVSRRPKRVLRNWRSVIAVPRWPAIISVSLWSAAISWRVSVRNSRSSERTPANSKRISERISSSTWRMSWWVWGGISGAAGRFMTTPGASRQRAHARHSVWTGGRGPSGDAEIPPPSFRVNHALWGALRGWAWRAVAAVWLMGLGSLARADVPPRLAEAAEQQGYVAHMMPAVGAAWFVIGLIVAALAGMVTTAGGRGPRRDADPIVEQGRRLWQRLLTRSIPALLFQGRAPKAFFTLQKLGGRELDPDELFGDLVYDASPTVTPDVDTPQPPRPRLPRRPSRPPMLPTLIAFGLTTAAWLAAAAPAAAQTVGDAASHAIAHEPSLGIWIGVALAVFLTTAGLRRVMRLVDGLGGLWRRGSRMGQLLAFARRLSAGVPPLEQKREQADQQHEDADADKPRDRSVHHASSLASWGIINTPTIQLHNASVAPIATILTLIWLLAKLLMTPTVSRYLHTSRSILPLSRRLSRLRINGPLAPARHEGRAARPTDTPGRRGPSISAIPLPLTPVNRGGVRAWLVTLGATTLAWLAAAAVAQAAAQASTHHATGGVPWPAIIALAVALLGLRAIGPLGNDSSRDGPSTNGPLPSGEAMLAESLEQWLQPELLAVAASAGLATLSRLLQALDGNAPSLTDHQRRQLRLGLQHADRKGWLIYAVGTAWQWPAGRLADALHVTKRSLRLWATAAGAPLRFSPDRGPLAESPAVWMPAFAAVFDQAGAVTIGQVVEQLDRDGAFGSATADIQRALAASDRHAELRRAVREQLRWPERRITRALTGEVDTSVESGARLPTVTHQASVLDPPKQPVLLSAGQAEALLLTLPVGQRTDLEIVGPSLTDFSDNVMRPIRRTAAGLEVSVTAPEWDEKSGRAEWQPLVLDARFHLAQVLPSGALVIIALPAADFPQKLGWQTAEHANFHMAIEASTAALRVRLNRSLAQADWWPHELEALLQRAVPAEGVCNVELSGPSRDGLISGVYLRVRKHAGKVQVWFGHVDLFERPTKIVEHEWIDWPRLWEEWMALAGPGRRFRLHQLTGEINGRTSQLRMTAPSNRGARWTARWLPLLALIGTLVLASVAPAGAHTVAPVIEHASRAAPRLGLALAMLIGVPWLIATVGGSGAGSGDAEDPRSLAALRRRVNALNLSAVQTLHVHMFLDLLGLMTDHPRARALGIGPERFLEGRLLNVGLQSRGSRVLEHNLVTVLRPLGVDVVGVSPAAEDDPARGLVRGVVQELPFADNQFDGAVSIGVFNPEYFDSVQRAPGVTPREFYTRAAEEFHRVVRPNGVVLLNFGIEDNPLCVRAFAGLFEPIDLGHRSYLFINRKLTDDEVGTTEAAAARVEEPAPRVEPAAPRIDDATPRTGETGSRIVAGRQPWLRWLAWIVLGLTLWWLLQRPAAGMLGPTDGLTSWPSTLLGASPHAVAQTADEVVSQPMMWMVERAASASGSAAIVLDPSTPLMTADSAGAVAWLGLWLLLAGIRRWRLRDRRNLTSDPPQLIEALRLEDASVRSEVMRLLDRIGRRRAWAAPELHRDGRVRMLVARALGILGGRHALRLLVQALDDPDDLVRTVATIALNNADQAEVLRHLRAAGVVPARRESVLPRRRTQPKVGLVILDSFLSLHGHRVRARAEEVLRGDPAVSVYERENIGPLFDNTLGEPRERRNLWPIEELVREHPDTLFVVNLSIGMWDPHLVAGMLPVDQVRALGAQGVVFVVAAQNYGAITPIRHPLLDNVVYVSARDPATGRKVAAANYGPHVDFTADGEFTSFAAPAVAARLALWLARHPRLSSLRALAQLRRQATRPRSEPLYRQRLLGAGHLAAAAGTIARHVSLMTGVLLAGSLLLAGLQPAAAARTPLEEHVRDVPSPVDSVSYQEITNYHGLPITMRVVTIEPRGDAVEFVPVIANGKARVLALADKQAQAEQRKHGPQAKRPVAVINGGYFDVRTGQSIGPIAGRGHALVRGTTRVHGRPVERTRIGFTGQVGRRNAGTRIITPGTSARRDERRLQSFITAGPTLLHNGNVFVSQYREKFKGRPGEGQFNSAWRSAIANSWRGCTLFITAIHERGRAVSYYQFARLIRYLRDESDPVWEAAATDGGGSSAIYMKRADGEWEGRGHGRRVANAVVALARIRSPQTPHGHPASRPDAPARPQPTPREERRAALPMLWLLGPLALVGVAALGGSANGNDAAAISGPDAGDRAKAIFTELIGGRNNGRIAKEAQGLLPSVVDNLRAGGLPDDLVQLTALRLARRVGSPRMRDAEAIRRLGSLLNAYHRGMERLQVSPENIRFVWLKLPLTRLEWCIRTAQQLAPNRYTTELLMAYQNEDPEQTLRRRLGLPSRAPAPAPQAPVASEGTMRRTGAWHEVVTDAQLRSAGINAHHREVYRRWQRGETIGSIADSKGVARETIEENLYDTRRRLLKASRTMVRLLPEWTPILGEELSLRRLRPLLLAEARHEDPSILEWLWNGLPAILADRRQRVPIGFLQAAIPLEAVVVAPHPLAEDVPEAIQARTQALLQRMRIPLSIDLDRIEAADVKTAVRRLAEETLELYLVWYEQYARMPLARFLAEHAARAGGKDRWRERLMTLREYLRLEWLVGDVARHEAARTALAPGYDPNRAVVAVLRAAAADGRWPVLDAAWRALLEQRYASTAIQRQMLLALGGNGRDLPASKLVSTGETRLWGRKDPASPWMFLESAERYRSPGLLADGFAELAVDNERPKQHGLISAAGVFEKLGPDYVGARLTAYLRRSGVAAEYLADRVIVHEGGPAGVPTPHTIYWKQVWGHRLGETGWTLLESYRDRSPQHRGRQYAQQGFNIVRVERVPLNRNGQLEVFGEPVMVLGPQFGGRHATAWLMWSPVRERYLPVQVRLGGAGEPVEGEPYRWRVVTGRRTAEEPPILLKTFREDAPGIRRLQEWTEQGFIDLQEMVLGVSKSGKLSLAPANDAPAATPAPSRSGRLPVWLGPVLATGALWLAASGVGVAQTVGGAGVIASRAGGPLAIGWQTAAMALAAATLAWMWRRWIAREPRIEPPGRPSRESWRDQWWRGVRVAGRAV